jgi:non-ribosomal peptide synthetase component F
MVRLAAFVAHLAREVDGRDILLGTYATNRGRLALQSIHGFFVNHLALRFAYAPELSFRARVRIVRQVVAEAELHGAIPFEQLCAELERDGVGRPPVTAIFRTSRAEPEVAFADIKMSVVNKARAIRYWGFTLNHDEIDEKRCWATFDTDLYDPARVRAFLDRYGRFVAVVSRNPDRPMRELLADTGADLL